MTLEPAATFCPATMCPLFAVNGSPWTSDVNRPCEREACGWFHKGNCIGQSASLEGIGECVELGLDRIAPKTFDCPRAHECQWQIEAGKELCAPRRALSAGVHPRASAY